MYFEILNTIQFLVIILISAIVYHQLKKKKVINTSWKVYWLAVLVIAMISYKQFFTLTEQADVIKAQQTMEKQSSSIVNSKSIQEYLDANKPTGLSKKERYEKELEEQSNKSKQLAKEIKAKHK